MHSRLKTIKCLDNQGLISAYTIIFAGCFMLLVYEPILMYATNTDEFWFDFSTMIIPTMAIFVVFMLIGMAASIVVYYINRIYDKKMTVYKTMVLTGFLIFLLAYIQGNLMTKNLPPLDGSDIIWRQYGKVENIIIFVLAVIIGLAIYILVRKYTFDRVIKAAAKISIIVCVILFVSLASEVIRNHAWENKENAVFSMDNFNTISENRNFLIFLVDAVDSEAFDNVLNGNPEYCQVFDDFTYYKDAATVYAFTRDVIPLVLSGKMNRNEQVFWKYSSEAYNNSELYDMLKNNTRGGYRINLYDPEIMWNGNRDYEVCNISTDNDSTMIFDYYMKTEMKYILFKYLPYCLKKYSKIEKMNFNICKKNNTDLTENNVWIYDRIIENPQLNKTSENVFQFIHAEGAHIPYNYDKYLNRIEEGTYAQKIEASITLVNAYIQRLKENDVYDNSVIIVMADHGETTKNTDLEIFERFNPILLIKGFDEKHELLKSDLPVSYLDLPGAYGDLLEGIQSTELFKNIQTDRTRTFIWYRYNRENHMVEYETSGNMKEIEKFKPTGSIYDR